MGAAPGQTAGNAPRGGAGLGGHDLRSRSDAPWLAWWIGLARQDRDAVGGWIEGQTARQEGKRLLGDLPRLPGGEGYLWVPDRGILDRVVVTAIRTFDSSRTSKRGVTAGAAARARREPVRDGIRGRPHRDRRRACRQEDHPGRPKAPPRARSNEDLRCSAGAAQPDPAGKIRLVHRGSQGSGDAASGLHRTRPSR